VIIWLTGGPNQFLNSQSSSAAPKKLFLLAFVITSDTLLGMLFDKFSRKFGSISFIRADYCFISPVKLNPFLTIMRLIDCFTGGSMDFLPNCSLVVSPNYFKYKFPFSFMMVVQTAELDSIKI
jgi:hypothetical protein